MTRAELPTDAARVVRELRGCRDTMMEVRQVRDVGLIFDAAHVVTAAIDAFAPC